MAQRVRIELTDDLLNDGTPADETVTFALDGINYEIDLNADNASRLRDELSVWVGSARRNSGRRQQGPRGGQATRRRGSSSPTSANAVREWARAQGMEVSDRGRVKDEVKAAYEAAHS